MILWAAVFLVGAAAAAPVSDFQSRLRSEGAALGVEEPLFTPVEEPLCALPRPPVTAAWCAREAGAQAAMRRVRFKRRLVCNVADPKLKKPATEWAVDSLYFIGTLNGRLRVAQAVYFTGLKDNPALRARFRQAFDRARVDIHRFFARHGVDYDVQGAIEGDDRRPAAAHVNVRLVDGRGRSNIAMWYLQGDETAGSHTGMDVPDYFAAVAAHELAHGLGFSDLYVDPKHNCKTLYGPNGINAARGQEGACLGPSTAKCPKLMGVHASRGIATAILDDAEFADMVRPLCPRLCQP